MKDSVVLKLTEKQKKAINQALLEIENGNIISDDEVEKEIVRWLKECN